MLARILGKSAEERKAHSNPELGPFCFFGLQAAFCFKVAEESMTPRLSRTQFRFFHLGLNSLPFPGAALVLMALKHTYVSNFVFLELVSPPKHPGASILQVKNLERLNLVET